MDGDMTIEKDIEIKNIGFEKQESPDNIVSVSAIAEAGKELETKVGDLVEKDLTFEEQNNPTLIQNRKENIKRSSEKISKRTLSTKVGFFLANASLFISMATGCTVTQIKATAPVEPVEIPKATQVVSSEGDKKTQKVESELEASMDSSDSTDEETPIPEVEIVTAEKLGIDNSFTEEEFNVLIKGNMQKLISVHRREGNAFLIFLTDYVSGDVVIRNQAGPYIIQNGVFAEGLESHIWHDPDADEMVDAYSQQQYATYDENGDMARNWDPNGEYNQFFLLVKAEDEYGEYNFVVSKDGGYWRVQNKPMYAPTNEINGVPTSRMEYIPLSDVSKLTPQEREWAQEGYMVFDYRYGNGVGRGNFKILKK